jgi:transcriptional regulator with XRE-family HTH domain
MSLDLSEITQRIDLLRKEKGWSQEAFAAELDISQAAVSYYLKERIPPADILLKMARLGNTTMEWLLTGEKSYLISKDIDQVHDPSETYDADLSLVRKIAALPPEIRSSLSVLIDHLNTQRT